MAITFDAKLLALGPAGRTRLSRAWSDPDTTTNRIQSAFGLISNDIAKLKLLLGPRPVVPTLRHCAPRGLRGGMA